MTQYSTSKKSRIYLGLKKRISILAVLSLIGLIVGQLGLIYWRFELLSHFMLFYLISFILGIWSFKRRSLKILCLVFSIGLVLWSLPNRTFFQSHPIVDSRNLQLTHLNLHFDFDKTASDRYHKTIKLEPFFLFHQKEYPHLFLITEFDNESLEIFTKRFKAPNCAKADDSPFGIAFFSDVPLESCDVLTLEGLSLYPFIRAEIDNTVIYGIHPPPPVNEELAKARIQYFDELAKRINQEQKTVIVIGDFNSTPFSPLFRSFVNKTGLKDLKNRLTPTWVPGFLNLDHILICSPDSLVDYRTYWWWQISDHRMVEIIFNSKAS